MYIIENTNLKVLEKEDVLKLFRKRQRECNKGDFNSCVIFASSRSYVGAAKIALSGEIAMRMGVGYCRLAVIESLIETVGRDVYECIISPQKEKDGAFLFDKDAVEKTVFNAKSVAVGMGMTKSAEVRKLVEYLLENFDGNLILDADALNSVSKEVLKKKKRCDVLITPHIKEFSRLTGLDVEEIKANKTKLAKEFAIKSGVKVLLKSESTVITDGNDCYAVIETSPSLAKGGSGDYLSGAICSLAANNGLLISAATASSLIGYVAKELSEKYNENVLLSKDLSEGIRDFFEE